MTFYFDMDGVLAGLYNVPNWLEYLENEDTTPYAVAKPALNFSLLARRIHQLQRKGYKVGIISWLSKSGTNEYNAAVTTIKKAWLKKHLPSVDWNETIIIPYGTPSTIVLMTSMLYFLMMKSATAMHGKAKRAWHLMNPA